MQAKPIAQENALMQAKPIAQENALKQAKPDRAKRNKVGSPTDGKPFDKLPER